MYSKRQLRANRRHGLNAWLATHHMNMDEAYYWTAAQRAAEEAWFAELDKIYEADKAMLRKELEAMRSGQLVTWFTKNGWTARGATAEAQIDDYMTRT